MVDVSVQVGEEPLGIHIRGGKEYGIGIFVSKVDADSKSEDAGLLVSDECMLAMIVSLVTLL
jgi:hypothetical protein